MSVKWYLPPAPVVFKVSGKDARRYLNNRLSNDLRTVAAGATLLAGALTPQGRVEGLYTIFVESQETFYLVATGGERQPLFASLSRYIVADRVSIVDCSSDVVVGHLGGNSMPQLGALRVLVAPCRRISDGGFDFIVLEGARAEIVKSLDEALGVSLTREQYNLLRFSQGCVEFPTEVDDGVILTEAGLREAVSFTKGCYVGQEVIERSDAIGKLPRRVERVVFEGSSGIAADANIMGGEGKYVGKVLSAFVDATQNVTKAFALLKNGAYVANDAVQCDGIVGRILSLEERSI
jgi:folate-binding protein YgfZ